MICMGLLEDVLLHFPYGDTEDDDDYDDYDVIEEADGDTVFYIDKSCVLGENFAAFVENEADRIAKKQGRIVIFKRSLEELKKCQENVCDAGYQEARRGMEQLSRLQARQLLFVAHDDCGESEQEEILFSLLKNSRQEDIVFVTEDELLASDVDLLNEIESVELNSIEVCFIDEDGQLGIYDFDDD